MEDFFANTSYRIRINRKINGNNSIGVAKPSPKTISKPDAVWKNGWQLSPAAPFVVVR
jgi:hypothetical protein